MSATAYASRQSAGDPSLVLLTETLSAKRTLRERDAEGYARRAVRQLPGRGKPAYSTGLTAYFLWTHQLRATCGGDYSGGLRSFTPFQQVRSTRAYT
ncbi:MULTISPECIES: hypothetical protein [Nostocales]|uniref:Uncharacterized protein n=3 Tax=Nostocales TaxID=1161 RepID=A0A8S9SX81_9CYAN|nr:hypothetical protein [Tolypothrix bouteillei]KAF3883952.1 hypothetical protein DA73_0400040375 [Tolypothrix bouteillei VB521301]